MNSSETQFRAVRSLPILLLAAAAFAIGSTEFLAIGVVPEIGRDLHVSTGAAGLTVSLYAVGVAITTLPMVVGFGHRRPRYLVAGLILLFASAHVLIAIAPSLVVLLIGRLLAATSHGLVLGVAMTTASAMVAPKDRSRALAMVFGGLLTAMFLGAPLGTWLTGLFGWRWVFALLGIVSALLGVLLAFALPDMPGADSRGWSALRPLRSRGVLAPLGIVLSLLGAGSVLFTYLGAYLDDVTGLGGGGVAAGLLVYGGASVVGNWIGGHVGAEDADRRIRFSAYTLVAALLVFGIAGATPIFAFGAAIVWAMSLISVIPVATHRAIEAGGSVAGPAQNMAANVGIALGGLLGGVIVSTIGLAAAPFAAAAVAGGVALVLTIEPIVYERRLSLSS